MQEEFRLQENKIRGPPQPDTFQGRRRILILEDDPGMAELQRRRLSELGYSVTIVLHSGEAHRQIAKGTVDLLLLDYKLSESISGLEFYKSLIEAGTPVPAILVTGLGHETVLAEAMRVGVRGFVLKTESYWDDLTDTVARVTRQLDLERAALESERIRENEEKLNAAFAAASVGHWRWETDTNTIVFSEICRQFIGCPNLQLPLSGFFLAIHEPDRPHVALAFERARRESAEFEVEYRVCPNPDGEIRWLLTKGSRVSPGVGEAYYNGNQPHSLVTGVTTDITERRRNETLLQESFSEIKALNDRLRASVVETHHRVKNSLQTIASLIQIELRDRQSLSVDEVQKLISHLRGFAALHEVLGEDNTSSCQDVHIVELGPLMDRLLAVLGPLCVDRLTSEVDRTLRVTSRQGSAIAVILNELVVNAIKYGDGQIKVGVGRHAEAGVLIVSSEGSSFSPDFAPEKTGRTGLMLVSTIAKTELGSRPEFIEQPAGWATVRIRFPLQLEGSPMKAVSAAAST